MLLMKYRSISSIAGNFSAKNFPASAKDALLYMKSQHSQEYSSPLEKTIIAIQTNANG
jgi:hypothetical protein